MDQPGSKMGVFGFAVRRATSREKKLFSLTPEWRT
jgi:hypothetical protein